MKASNNSFDAKTRGNTVASFGAIHYRYYWGTSRLAANLEQIVSSAAGSPELLWSGCKSAVVFYSHQCTAASEGLVHFRAYMTWPWWASIRQKAEHLQGLPAASEKGKCVRNLEIYGNNFSVFIKDKKMWGKTSAFQSLILRRVQHCQQWSYKGLLLNRPWRSTVDK